MSLEKNTANSSSPSTATTPWSLVSGLKQGVDKGDASYQEVADQLGMGLNSVRTAIFRLLASMNP